MSAEKKKKQPNLTQVNGRLLVDEYHTIAMCPECHTLLEAPRTSLPSCPCGTDNLPVGEICRLTVCLRSAKERCLHVFVVQKDQLTTLAVIFREDGPTTKKDLAMNASYRTKYYPVDWLDPDARLLVEQHSRIVEYIRSKLELME